MNRALPLTTAILLCTLVWAKAVSKPVDLTLRDFAGNRVHLRDLRGKIVVLNFWATWCGPCKEEFPLLVKTEKQMRSRGVVFVAISLDEPQTRDAIPAFLKRFDADFPVWTGATADDLDRLKMGGVVPATAFLDEEGSVVARVSGEIRESELTERLEWLLGGRKGAPPEALVTHLQPHLQQR